MELLILSLLFIIFVFPIVTFIVATLLHKERLANISVCIILWLVFPFALPAKVKQYSLIRRPIWRWLLALLSPMAIACYAIIFLFLGLTTESKSKAYESLSFTSREEIAAITEIADFPEFEYLNNTYYGWDDVTYTRHKFTNEKEVEKLFSVIESKIVDRDNIFWSVVTLTDEEDKTHFGSDTIYVCKRGWDTDYMDSPDVEHNYTQVQIAIGSKGFTVRDAECYPWDMEYYSSPDSLSLLTGVSFPSYKIVNLDYWGESIDPAFIATLKLDKKPSRAFIQSIQTAEHWVQLDDGTYRFHLADRKGDLWEDITIDPNSRLVELSVNTY